MLLRSYAFLFTLHPDGDRAIIRRAGGNLFGAAFPELAADGLGNR